MRSIALRSWRTHLIELLRAAFALRAPLFLTFVVYGSWVSSPQFREVFYSFAENANNAPHAITWVYFVSLVFWSTEALGLMLFAMVRERKIYVYYAIIITIISIYGFLIFVTQTIDIAHEFNWPGDTVRWIIYICTLFTPILFAGHPSIDDMEKNSH